MEQSAQGYSKREEMLNALSHGIGALLSIIGGIVMFTSMPENSSIIRLLAVALYGLSMTALYAMSTFYHAISNHKAKRILRVFDHASIYLLIAGCYTPMTIIILGGTPTALILLAAVWAAAVLGIVLNVIDMVRFKRIGMALYLIMGWAALLQIKNIVVQLGLVGSVLFVAGGLAYTVGVIFYRMKRTKYMHALWHLFVLAGSVLHYLCILGFIVHT